MFVNEVFVEEPPVKSRRDRASCFKVRSAQFFHVLSVQNDHRDFLIVVSVQQGAQHYTVVFFL